MNSFPRSLALVGASITSVLLLGGVTPVQAQGQPTSSDPAANRVLKSNPVIALPDQKYALCAGAVTFNLDGITYARCAYLDGDSISGKQSYKGGNIQTINNIGTSSGAYVVSTFSPPSPSEYALYSCKAQGAFAQCDGGVCFESSRGKPFPGLGTLANNEIICSCPIVTSSNYHMFGPAACPKTRSQYDKVCGKGSEKATTKNGASLRIGSSGPSAVGEAYVAYYDKVFGTSNGVKKCDRP